MRLPSLGPVGRHANDILYQKDRQRLKAFIYRLGGSRDSSAIERRARIIVDGIMRGSLGGRATLSLDRLVSCGDYLIRGATRQHPQRAPKFSPDTLSQRMHNHRAGDRCGRPGEQRRQTLFYPSKPASV